MKTEPNSFAYPVIGMGYEATGLTKLEYFTAMAMQPVIISKGNPAIISVAEYNNIGYEAVDIAKRTIEALNKEK